MIPPLDYANDPALKTLYPSPPGPFASLGMTHLSLEIVSLFFLCVCLVAESCPTLGNIFFPFLLLINFLAMGKTLESSLHPYQELRPIGGRVSKLCFCWQFIVFSHGKRDQEALWGTSFISTLMPFMRAPLLWPHHLPKAPPPNIITLRVKSSTKEFWGYITIETTTIGKK